MDFESDEEYKPRPRRPEKWSRRKSGDEIPRIVRFESFSDEEVKRRRSRLGRRSPSPPRAPRQKVSFERLREGDRRNSLGKSGSSPAPPRRGPRADRADDSGWHLRSSKQIPSPPPAIRVVREDHHVVSRDMRVPSPPPVSRRRVSFNDLPPPRPITPPPAERARGNAFLSPTYDSRFRDVPRDSSPRVKYRTGETPPSPSQVPIQPVRIVGSSSYAPESQRKAWAPKRGGSSSVTPSDSASARPSVSPSSSTGTLGDKLYHYRPLGPREFRLVQIQPMRMAAVKCNILHYSLEKPPRYIALSYAWGDAGDTRKIHVDGVLVPVAASLCGALEALRQRGEQVLIWADALSIDQSNQEEQTQQVRLMASIYAKAESVFIWLGPESDDSSLAMDLLHALNNLASSQEEVRHLLSSLIGKRDVGAVVSLFERDYWRRLWVVQEVFNARAITVCCGSRKLPYGVYETASRVFRRHRGDLDRFFPGSYYRSAMDIVSPNQFTVSQVLVYQGPASLPDLRPIVKLGDESLLEVLRACRRKLAAQPKDKVYGILGVLPEAVREDFAPDYSKSVKEVYTDVVDFLMTTTQRVDVICEAIHFPLHVDSASLPTFVPNWSHMPHTASLCSSFNFRASGSTKARCEFLDERRNKLQLSAIYLDTIKNHGIAVGTLCTLADYLMAFLHWRALLLGGHDAPQGDSYSFQVEEAFCRTLCLGQVPGLWKSRPRAWMEACYLVFASLLHERSPRLPLDSELRRYVDAKVDAIKPGDRRRFLQENFGAHMMGRCFCLTAEGRMGMGTGFMAPGDMVVIPLGCETPILIRHEGKGEYRFVGDVYINGYMQGKAVEQWREGKREVKEYVLH